MNNDYFTPCRMSNEQDLIDAYLCCKNTCQSYNLQQIPKLKIVKKHLCTSICKKMFDEDVNYKAECAYDMNCWDNYWNKKCITNNEKKIHDCCVEKCKQDQNIDFDCNKYCKHYEII